jgi:hypothetical protein
MTKDNFTKADFMALLKEVRPEIEPKITGLESPTRLWRYDKGDERYYFEFVGDMIIPFLSVTEFTKKSLPTSPFLIQWIASHGTDVARHVANCTAAYGTLLHKEITMLCKTGEVDFNALAQRAIDEAIDMGYDYKALDWSSEVVKDVAAFLVFAEEKELEVIGSEIAISSRKYGLAGCIDLPCRLKFGRGKVNAIIDIKSGRKGFWPEHELQLLTYREIWNDIFKEVFEVTHVFNWSPTDWREKPAYKFQNQTESAFVATVVARMGMAKAEGWINPPTGHMEIVGVAKLGAFKFDDHKSISIIKNPIEL